MKHSRVSVAETPHSIDVARIVRGKMAEEQLTASDLARTFGGAVTYWTRRATGLVAFSPNDLQLIGWATRTHPAVFLGGEAPAGWTAPEPPTCPQYDSNVQPTDYEVEGWPVGGRFGFVRWGVA